MKNIVIVICFFFSFNAFSQHGTLKGNVKMNGELLEFASVHIDGTSIGALTDIDGNFKIGRLDPGKYNVIASFVGAIPRKKPVIIETGGETHVEFDISSSAELAEVVVTGTLRPTYVSDSPVKVDVITAKKLNTYLPGAASSLVDNVALVNGVQEVVACGVCYTNSISINGLEGPYTAILMDGTPIYGNLASVYGLNGIPNMLIDRFEVIKGPNSTLYGSEAVAGVINIITKDPKDEPILALDIMGTTHKESFGNVGYTQKIGGTYGFTGVNWAHVNDFDDYNKDGFGDAVNLDRLSVFSKWDIGRKSGKAFSLATKYYYEDRRNGVEEFLEERNYRQIRGSNSIYGESIYTERFELFGTYEFAGIENLKFDYSFSNHDQDSYYGDIQYIAKQRIGYGSLIWNKELKDHNLIIGSTLRYDGYDDNTIATATSDAEGRNINQPEQKIVPGIFIQDEFFLNDQTTLLSGIRLDHYGDHGMIFSPRLSMKYKPDPWTTLRANLGTGFRLVNLFTEDHAFVTGQREVEIREDLKPERSKNINLNFNHIHNLLGGSGSIDIDAYYTHFTNKIIPSYDIPGKIIYENTQGFARTMGVGLSFNQSFTFPLSFNLGVNLLKAERVETDENGSQINSEIEFAPRWSSILSINYRPFKNFSLGLTANTTGHMRLPEVYDLNENGIPGSNARPTISDPFSLLNLQLSQKFGQKWEIYAGIQNLTNYRQATSPLIGYNDPNSAIGFSPYFDTSYAYAPNHGRELYLGIKWSLGQR